MNNKELPDQIKVNVWQSYRTTLGVWEAICLSLLTAGSALVASAYGIVLVNSEKLGGMITLYLCIVLFVACICIEYVVFMFNNSVKVLVECLKDLEDDLFGEEKSYLKITHNLARTQHKFFPLLKFRVYMIWGGIILLSAFLVTLWRLRFILVN